MNFKKFLDFLIGPVVVIILGFISIPLMTKLFSTEAIGKFAILQVIITLSIVILSLGLDLSYIRNYYETDNKKSFLFITLIPGLAFLFFLVIISIFINPSVIVSEVFSSDNIYYFYISILSIFFSFLIRFFSLPLRMENKGKSFSIVQSCPKFFLFFFLLFSYCFNLVFDDSIWLLLAHSTSLFLALVVNIFFLGTPLFSVNFSSFKISNYRELFRFGLPAAVSGLVFWLFQSSDKLLLKMLSPLSELGIYSVAFSVAAGVAVFSNVFNMLWTPYIYEKLSDKGEVDGLEHFIDFYLMFTYFFLGIAIALSPMVTFFFSEEYSLIQYFIACCALGFLFYSLSEMTAIGINIKKKTAVGLVATVLSAILGIIISYFLVLYFSAVGAAIGMLISYWIYMVLRTEVSIQVWKMVDRIKIYSITFISLSFSSLFAIFKLKEYGSVIFWVIIYYIIGILIFRKTYKQTIKFVFKLKSSN